MDPIISIALTVLVLFNASLCNRIIIIPNMVVVTKGYGILVCCYGDHWHLWNGGGRKGDYMGIFWFLFGVPLVYLTGKSS